MAQWSSKRVPDVIFCRNVADHFDEPTQMKIWSRFAELPPVAAISYRPFRTRIRRSPALPRQYRHHHVPVYDQGPWEEGDEHGGTRSCC